MGYKYGPNSISNNLSFNYNINKIFSLIFDITFLKKGNTSVMKNDIATFEQEVMVHSKKVNFLTLDSPLLLRIFYLKFIAQIFLTLIRNYQDI